MATKAEAVESKATHEIEQAIRNLRAIGVSETEIRRACERILNRTRHA